MGTRLGSCCCNRDGFVEQQQYNTSRHSNENESKSSKSNGSSNISNTKALKSSLCSNSNCFVIENLKKYSSTFCKPLNDKMDRNFNKYFQYEIDKDFEHYLLQHSQYDDRTKNECNDKECLYETEYNKSNFSLSNIQRIHAYFYHYNKYQKLKTQRSHKFMQNVDDPNKLIDDKNIYTQISLNDDENDDDEDDEEEDDESIDIDDDDVVKLHKKPTRSGYQSTTVTQIEGNLSYNLSEQISRLLLPILPIPQNDTNDDLLTPDSPEGKRNELSLSLTTPYFVNTVQSELCEESIQCDKVKKLLIFAENIDPKTINNHQYNEQYIEEIKLFWDHYCESHMEEYKKSKCIHCNINDIKEDDIDEEDDDDDDDDDDKLCEFVKISYDCSNLQLLLLLHRHFYHCNIMKDENHRIRYIKETMHGQKVIDKFKPTMDAILSSQNTIQSNKVLEFGYEYICDINHAKFKNPKQEILQNTYFCIQITHWNQLFNKCTAPNGYSKSLRTKQLKLKLKEVIALKLYTDFDELQRVYRKCYRENDQDERFKMQREFYHWNKLIKSGVDKSTDIITQTLYHGINCELNVATFSGKYYGPVSTTKLFDVAKGFAGSKGKILEIYPSYGKKGLQVSWLSNFPDEQEVLYFNATFNIKNIFSNYDDEQLQDKESGDILLSANTLRDLQTNTQFIEKSILKALQTINVESTILSFNEIDDDCNKLKKSLMNNSNNNNNDNDNDAIDDESKYLISDQQQRENIKSQIIREEDEEKYNDTVFDEDEDDEDDKNNNNDDDNDDVIIKEVEQFKELQGSEVISILYLLYLQYKPIEWEQLVRSDKDIYTQIALAKYRDQFAHLTQNVTTIRMESASELIKYFFSINMDDENEYNLNNNDSIPSPNDDAGRKELRNIISHSGKFNNMKYNIRFETIIKLFPQCKQISIDGDNFDWTLLSIISFLRSYNLDFSGIQLQDIFIRFKQDYSSQSVAEDIAQKRLKKLKKSRKQLAELGKLGWRFITSSHIHRFGFEPEVEKPFLILFMTEGRVFHHSYSKRILGGVPQILATTSSAEVSINNISTPNMSRNNTLFERAITLQSLRSLRSLRSLKTGRSSVNLSVSINNSINIEGDHAIIDYNPKHLFLSKQMINKCHYKDDLILLLEHRKNRVCLKPTSSKSISLLPPSTPTKQLSTFNIIDEDLFDNICIKVETLILYPIHNDLIHIFYQTFAEKKPILQFKTIKLMFPNVTDIYLRDITFTHRACNNLLQFVIDDQLTNKSNIKRIFYSVDKQCANRDVAKLKLRLNLYQWDFSQVEQVAFKTSFQGY